MNKVKLNSLDEFPDKVALRTAYILGSTAYMIIHSVDLYYDVIYFDSIKMFKYQFMFNGTLQECRNFINRRFTIETKQAEVAHKRIQAEFARKGI